MVQFIKNKVRRYLYEFELRKKFKEFQISGRTSPETYKKFRRTFVLSRGTFNETMSAKINRDVGKMEIEAKGILGDLSENNLEKIAKEIKENGFYIFERSLPEHVTEKIYNFALTEPARFLNFASRTFSEEKVLFDPNNIISPRYNFSRTSILKSPELQQLIFDNSIRAVAQEYLGCKPILDHLAFWWSAPFKGKVKSEAAQMYHFDMDRIKFLKFFFYLTDVNTDNGPHCYVRGSNKKLPKEINRDGRFSDDIIYGIYGKENCIEILGKKGSIMAVDTRGFHKGKDLSKDHRLLFQIEFANSMFGQTYSSLKPTLIEKKYNCFLQSYTYKQLFQIS